MGQARSFPKSVLTAIDEAKILWIRAGIRPRRFRGIWVVVVEGRVFVRSWNDKPTGWYRAWLDDPRGAIKVGEREVRVRARRTRSERLRDAVDRAYAAKYVTPASRTYVKGFAQRRRKETTLELIPR
jgi:hypothetical protein